MDDESHMPPQVVDGDGARSLVLHLRAQDGPVDVVRGGNDVDGQVVSFGDTTALVIYEG